MLDGMTIGAAVDTCFDKAQECIDDMLPLAEEVAEITREYRLAYKRVSIRLRDSGIAVSSLDKMTKGTKEVADLEYQITLAQAKYDANHEAELLWKKRADYYRELGSREWSRAGAEECF